MSKEPALIWYDEMAEVRELTYDEVCRVYGPDALPVIQTDVRPVDHWAGWYEKPAPVPPAHLRNRRERRRWLAKQR